MQDKPNKQVIGQGNLTEIPTCVVEFVRNISSNWVVQINPFSHMPILVSSNLVAYKDMISKIFTNGDIIF